MAAEGTALGAPPAADATAADEPAPRRPTGVRGKRQSALLRLRGDIPPTLRIGLAIGGVIALLGLWTFAAAVLASDTFPIPSITGTAGALKEMVDEGTLWPDLLASTKRVLYGYLISFVVGAVAGLALGSFRSVEAFVEPQIGFLRYIPASALTPLLVIWLGIEETPKIALIVVGTVFYNILMTADVVRAVPSPLINAAYTMGAGRRTVVRRVILPHSWPGMLDVARINLAAAWLMLVVSELIFANDGLAFRILRAQRFRRIDRMFALLVVFGLIGVVSDLLLRWLRNRTSPWAKP